MQDRSESIMWGPQQKDHGFSALSFKYYTHRKRPHTSADASHNTSMPINAHNFEYHFQNKKCPQQNKNNRRLPPSEYTADVFCGDVQSDKTCSQLHVENVRRSSFLGRRKGSCEECHIDRSSAKEYLDNRQLSCKRHGKDHCENNYLVTSSSQEYLDTRQLYASRYRGDDECEWVHKFDSSCGGKSLQRQALFSGFQRDSCGSDHSHRTWRPLRILTSRIWIHILVLVLLLQKVVVDGIGPPWPQPVFLPRLLNVTSREGGKAILPCAVHFLGTKEVTWKKVGADHFLSVGKITWTTDPNYRLEFRELTPEVTEWNMIIEKSTPEHAGQYQCQISDKKKLVRYIELSVIGPPLEEEGNETYPTLPPISVSGKNYVDLGHPIHLFCNTTGPLGTHLAIDWFKDGDKIDFNNYKRVVITNYNLVEGNVLVSELFIDRSQSSDTGTYICRSDNGYIDNIKVTVLFANTVNVKRENRESGCARATSLECLLLFTLINLGLWL